MFLLSPYVWMPALGSHNQTHKWHKLTTELSQRSGRKHPDSNIKHCSFGNRLRFQTQALYLCFMSGSDERKGSEIQTTGRAPPSQRFISTTRGQGENRLSNTTFWLLTLNPSLSFESGRDFQRHLRKRSNFRDLVVCLFAWVLFSRLLARSTKQL